MFISLFGIIKLRTKLFTVYNKNILSSEMPNYSFKLAGGNWLLPFLIRNKLYFILILTAYCICKKRYL